MAASIAVYCKRSVAEITPEEIVSALRSADFSLLVQGRGLLPFRLDDALDHLKVESVGSKGFDEYAFSYRPAPLPQCTIRRLPLVEGAHDPVLEELRTVHHPGMDKIRRHVDRAKEVVSIELDGPGQQMTALLASEIARWIADVGDGLIARSDQSWWDLDEQGVYRRILP